MDRHARFEEKRDFLIEWVLEFHYTTPRILCSALGLNRQHQSNFFASLKKSGLFKFIRHPFIRENVIILSHQGRNYAFLLSELAESYSMTESRIIGSNLIHNLNVQQAVISRADLSRPFNFRFDKNVTEISKGKRPDAVYMKNGVWHALEVEITQKSRNRIYAGFLEQIENMKSEHYELVEYIFPSASLMSRYQKRFNDDFWPIVYRDKTGKFKQQIRDGEPVMADARSDKIRQRFSFTTGLPYQ
ncbi:hypothetical protein [Methylophaga sp.]|uniref:hypothetical protein n=1 Tax=Methylophaga sp. TaxID=2024840 RepID=UPI003A8DEBA4